MDIKSYILQSAKKFNFRIKTLVPVDDAVMDKIERAIAKFQPLDISRPKKTMLQRHPLDFPNVSSGEVWIIDVVLGQPVSAVILREVIRSALDAPDSFVIVRNEDEALERETLLQNAISDIEEEAKKRGLKPASLLSTDPEYGEEHEIDGAALFGDKFNNALLTYLNTVEDERREAREKFDKSPFNWLDIPDKKDVTPADNGTYNADIEGAHKPRPTSADSKGVKLGEPVKAVKRIYVDAKGKRVVITRSLGE